MLEFFGWSYLVDGLGWAGNGGMGCSGETKLSFRLVHKKGMSLNCNHIFDFSCTQ